MPVTMSSTNGRAVLVILALCILTEWPRWVSGYTCDSSPAVNTPLGCDKMYTCNAISGDAITIPCGSTEETNGTFFNYSMYENSANMEVESWSVLTEFLTINVTAGHDKHYVYCRAYPGVSSHPCYQLDIEYPPQRISDVSIRPGQQNTVYCLSCQVESSPPPSCTWTITDCNATNCHTVYPSGVSFPEDPHSACHAPPAQDPLPSPVYPGCVVKIDQLTDEYQYYRFQCKAANSLGTFTNNPILHFKYCGPQDNSITLTPAGSEINITHGSSQVINCSVTNASPSSYIWWYRGNSLYLHTIQGMNTVTCHRWSAIQLDNVTDDDAGNYTCYFHKGSGVNNNLKSSSLFVNVVPITTAMEKLEEATPEPGNERGVPYTTMLAMGLTAAGAVLLIIVLSMAVIGYLASNSIKFFLRWRLKEPGYEHTVGSRRVAYNFDVFLSFSEQDKEDTIELLKDPLEERQYTVCWHHEAFLPGRLIMQNIEEGIRDSRKTVLVLSDNFFKSQYCKWELDVSFRKLKKTKTHCVVPILLKDCKKLPTDVKDLTYLDARSSTSSASDIVLISKVCRILGKPLTEISELQTTEEDTAPLTV